MTRIVFFIFFTLPLVGFGNHVAGGEIKWTCLGNDSIKVTANLYEFCGLQLNGATVELKSACGSKNFSMRGVSSREVTPVCESQCTQCSNSGCSFSFGVKQVQFSTIIDLSTWRKLGCCEFDLSIAMCCRPLNVTAFKVKTGGISISSTISLCKNGCIDAPEWADDPLVVACLGMDVQRMVGFTPSFSDSAVFSFDSLRQSSGASVVWNSSYAHNQPLIFLGYPKSELSSPRGFHLDSARGSLFFRPMKVETSSLNLKAELYRNGDYYGTIRRETTLSVTKCANRRPEVSAMQSAIGNFGTEKNLCDGDTFSFFVRITDVDSKDSLVSAFTTNLPNAKISLTKLSAKNDSIHVQVIADKSMEQGKRYYLQVNSKDFGCPIYHKALRFFYFYKDRNKGRSFTWKAKHVDCNDYDLVMDKTALLSHDRESWFLKDSLIGKGDSLRFTLKDTGQYIIKATLGDCGLEYIDSLKYHHPPVVVAEDDFEVCHTGPSVTLKASPTGGSWRFHVALSSNILRLDKLKTSNKWYTFLYSYTDSMGCTSSDEVRVKPVSNNIKIDIPQSVKRCIGKDSIVIAGKPIGGTWTGFGPTPIPSTVRFTADQVGVDSIYLSYDYENSVGCQAEDSTLVVIHPLPAASFIVHTPTVRLKDTFELESTSTFNGDGEHRWNIGQGLYLSTAKNPKREVIYKGLYDVKLIVTDVRSGCQDSLIKIGAIEASALPTSRAEIGLNEVSVFPNPMSDRLLISTSESAVFKLFDLQGRELQRTVLSEGLNTVNTAALEKSNYLITIITKQRLETFQIEKI